MTLANLAPAAIREPQAHLTLPGIDVEITSDDAPKTTTNPETGATQTALDNGDILIDFEPAQPKRGMRDGDFHQNLALVADFPISNIAQDLIIEIEDDIQSRSEWMDMRAQGLELLGLKIEQPRGDTGASSAPLEGMSTVRSSTLLKACLRFQANARGELLPAMGPVKIINNSTQETDEADSWSDILEKDMNIYLTQRLSGYYEDTDRMLFYIGFGGCGFKKVYHDPLKRRATSESIDADDLIVNNSATDLTTAKRVTHRIRMRESMVRRMQLAGIYRDAPLGAANYEPSNDEKATAQVMGFNVDTQRPDDQDRTIYEVLCERDFGEHDDALPLPYKVVIDKDSSQVLEIRRNWQDGDPMYMPVNMYVRFPYVEAMGFYGIGLLHILGNTTKALTAATRESLDAGMFASFPGFLYSDMTSRQETNTFRVPPGGGQAMKTGGGKIQDTVMPLPYKDVTPGLMSLMEMLSKDADTLSGTAELPTGEGIQNAPVGTTLAIIDQATKVLDAVHKRLHAAQSEEFRLLKERLLEDPESFWRHNPGGATNWDKESFTEALSRVDLVPVADPNTPTHTHRLMKAQALGQLAALYPQKFNLDNVMKSILRMIGYSSPDEFLVPAGTPPAPDPKMLELQLKQQELAQRAQSDKDRLAVDQQKNKIELQKTVVQGQTDQAELRGKMALERAKAASDARITVGKQDLDQRRLGLDIISEPHVAAHIDRMSGLAPPAVNGSAPGETVQ